MPKLASSPVSYIFDGLIIVIADKQDLQYV